ncbi:MAG TPA: BlaI/MecI/CopY family transcriptional regulator [Bryobacteraceae bacterium]|nr:BlaI/MecI/CopY family transcriptional regulator [Bryobacteraceae bacterium]
MPKAPRDVLPPLELLCLNALWSLQEGNVREVRQIVGQARPLAYTTIMTVLDRLVKKGKITRRKAGRAFIYSPQASRDTMRRAAIRELLDGFFDGSEEQLMAFLRKEEIVEVKAAAAAAGGDADGRIDTVLL